MKETDRAWSARKEVAARLVAEGELTNTQIAKKLKLGEATVVRWRRQPAFRDQVAENLNNLAGLIHSAFNKKYIERAKQRTDILDKIAAIVHTIPEDDLKTITEKPIAAINLMLRLQNAEELYERRRQVLDVEQEEDIFPRLSNLEPQALEQIIHVIEQDRAPKNSEHREPRAELR